MSKPVASISVPIDEVGRWRIHLRHFNDEIGPLSPAVFKMVVDGRVFDGDELQLYTARERLKNKEKRYLIVELD